MTAFAGSDLADDKFSVNIEIRGYNSRHLDIALRLTQQYGVLEEKIRKAIANRVARGRVEIKISISESAKTADAFSIMNQWHPHIMTPLLILRKGLH